MRKITLKILISLLLLGLALQLNSCETTEPLKNSFYPSGTYLLEWNSLPEIGSKLRLGGFTGLYYNGGRIFFAVTSRGPVLTNFNGEIANSFFVNKNYVPEIVKLELQDDGTVKIIERINIKNPLSQNCSGLPVIGAWDEDETILNEGENNDNWGIYPSGIFFSSEENLFYVSEQYTPSALQVTTGGNWFMKASPGEGFRNAYSNQTYNGGFTGIDFSSNGKIIVLLGRALEHNRNINDPDQTRPINYALRRVGIYGRTSRSDLSMFYFVDSTNTDEINVRKIILGDIKTVNDTAFLVTEFGEENGTIRSLLYKAVITDSTSQVQEGLEGIDGKSFETLSETEWNENNLVPLKKELLLDLSEFGFNKPEAIDIIDENHIAVINNNNFGISNPNPNDETFVLNKEDIRLTIIKLPVKLNLR